MNSMWGQLWHGYSCVPKGMKDAILVIDKEIVCIGRHVVFNELEHSCVDVLFSYTVAVFLLYFHYVCINKKGDVHNK